MVAHPRFRPLGLLFWKLKPLKAKSPTCGVHEIYDGTFSGKKIKGQGLLAKALRGAGVRVMDEEDVKSGVAGD